jgi:hypothetical protein
MRLQSNQSLVTVNFGAYVTYDGARSFLARRGASAHMQSF